MFHYHDLPCRLSTYRGILDRLFSRSKIESDTVVQFDERNVISCRTDHAVSLISQVANTYFGGFFATDLFSRSCDKILTPVLPRLMCHPNNSVNQTWVPSDSVFSRRNLSRPRISAYSPPPAPTIALTRKGRGSRDLDSSRDQEGRYATDSALASGLLARMAGSGSDGVE